MRNLFRPLAILLAVMMSLHDIAYAFELTPGATPAMRTHGRLCCVDAARSWAPAPGHAGCGRSDAGHDGPPRHASCRRSLTSDMTE
jgi:hypothetical protein